MISWTKEWSSADDGSLITGTQLGTLQSDIDAGVSGSLPTPSSSDALKIPRVDSAHAAYELVAQVPMAQGGTGADLSVGTAGYAVISTGTAGNMSLSPMYSSVAATFATDSAAQTVYVISPVTGVISTGYVCMFSSARGATYTATLGSAGVTMISATVASTGVAGAVTSMVLGTVAVTAGASIAVARGDQGTTGASVVTIVIIKTP